ncbi:bifunctional alpha/beta hydrolase/class I SAM-dependent methyltransferase [Desulfobulbus sp. TB]|nr:bifunctional alpha/beta hydrolase/class I SAM-dependent methyltransferase [Desulfobulbus sp. TB]
MNTYTIHEKRMTTWDGSELFYRAWLPEKAYTKAIVLFHRGHEHSGRLLGLAEQLALDDFAIFAWDARGNGQSPGPRDWAEDFSVYVRDADCFVRFIAAEYQVPVENMAVIANSVGGVIASAWVHDYAPRIRALVLAAPAFRIKLYVPFAVPMLRIALKLGLMKYVQSYVKSRVLTHDRQEQESFNSDPMISHSIATNILLDVYDTATRIVKDAKAIRTPTLLLMAGSDWVVKNGTQLRFFRNLGSATKEIEYYPGFYHAIFHETEKDKPIQRTRTFIREQFDKADTLPSLINADKQGWSKEEYDLLKIPSANPLYGIWYQLNRYAMRTLGKLSDGISLGWEEGFDSGVMLDYVYKNAPAGITPVGKGMDSLYLNTAGWAGIRIRKEHMEAMLEKCISSLDKAGKPVHIVDIAAGPGRYLLDTIKKFPDLKILTLLRDYKMVNIEEGRKTAAQMGLTSVVYEQGDAFNRKALAGLSPSPTLAVVSGLFELIPENEPLLNSLHGLADAMEKDAFLVYTNQPWHPQLEFIARVLTNREGEPWIMRQRTQEEMDDLIIEAGFEKIEMLIDQWGIFSVSVARKIV